jgi:hypothetical protein
MDERLGAIEEKLDRLLGLLDAKEQKKQKDRSRVKHKRDEEASAAALVEGKIVVENLAGTMDFDARLPYDEWAYIMLEFRQGYNFLRWMMHTYLESYHCTKDPRKRIIARKATIGNSTKSAGPSPSSRRATCSAASTSRSSGRTPSTSGFCGGGART